MKNKPKTSPSFEQVTSPLGLSFRLLSWDGSVAKPQIHHGQPALERTGGMGHRWHYHPEIELAHFSKGEGIRLVGDSIRQVNAPETVMLGSLLPHQWQVGESAGFALQFRVGPGSAFGEIPELRDLDRLWGLAAEGLLFDEELSERVGGALEKAVAQAPISRLGTIFELLGDIAQAFSSEKSAGVSSLSRPIRLKSGAAGYSEIISEAIEFISSRFRDPITLQDVLKHTSTSRATFSRHFPQFTGQSFTTFLQQYRLEYCRRLLIAGNHSITEAAFESGFQNLSHFNRLFRERWGQTPREFRLSL
ncbi:AraC family transcriptional regulator [Pelagicoccus mobilis]|uniref:Helix-turn-helix domain-containing protein n=1 Tax=Pelagicoccus mobilis TaxID=415221 RepID=A0A934S026_9BACT|nr:AraC family transcriptional regulator [Pelagicoccus mobilis]MBK1877437.1 helix-turn-helix domain-containing protein [Pelagicoccus mobilis]